MTNGLADVLNGIVAEFDGEILATANTYSLVDIGKASEVLGHPELKDRYDDVNAVIPLRRTRGGLNFEVNGKDLSDYAQLNSGIAVPAYVAEEAGLPSKQYQPKDRMVLNLA